MATDRWREIERIYHEALERDAGERATFVAGACGADEALRTEVESLLGYQRSADMFLEPAALEAAARDLVTGATPALAARRIGGYEVLAWLGEGGMGVVYRARDLRLGRDVALKLLPPAMAGDAGYLQRFEAEARLASVLNHPNIVTIYGVGDEGGTAFIAMELVQGRTLRERLDDGRVPTEQTLDLAIQIADALAAAHAVGIVHRDLKPENVMTTGDGLVKVLDFGLAKRDEAIARVDPGATRPALTQRGMILGTTAYMSPEQAAGRPAGAASDQFAFGLVLYEMLAGRRAFDRETTVETLSAIIREPPPPVRAANPEVSEPLQQLLERCLAKDAAQRYANTRDLAAALRSIRVEWHSSAPVLRARSATNPHESANAASPTRRRVLWLGAAATAALATGAATWTAWPRSRAITSLAVLPFVNAAHDEDAAHLCDGLAENLTDRLSHLASLSVMARSTVSSVKAKTDDPREAGRRLAVQAVLTGSVTRRAGRLLITAELVEVTTGARLWSGTYDRAAADVLAIQDEIASAIVDKGIRVRVSGDERQQLVRHPTDDPEAYELYLRAVQRARLGTEDDYLFARRLLQQAVSRDPRFARAYAALASTYAVMAIDGFERPTEAWPQSSRNLRQALELDPDIGDAHAELASAAFYFNWDWAAAEREWRMAMDRPGEPMETGFLQARALELWAIGRVDEALRIAHQARERNPAFAVIEADYLLHAGRLGEAGTLYQNAIRDEPGDPRAYFGFAEVRRAQGRFDEAIEARRRAHQVAGDDTLSDVLAKATGAAGYRQIEETTARLQVQDLENRATDAYVSPIELARAYAQLGEREKALGYFPAAFADRAPGLVFLKVDRAWDGVRDDPRFLEAVRRVGLP